LTVCSDLWQLDSASLLTAALASTEKNTAIFDGNENEAHFDAQRQPAQISDVTVSDADAVYC